MNPFDGRVLEGQCAALVSASPWVSVDAGAVDRLAYRLADGGLAMPGWDDDPTFALTSEVATVAWLLAYNAVNYCYWPDRAHGRWWTVVEGKEVGADDEALGVMGAFAGALRRGVPLDDAKFLVEMDASTLSRLLAPAPGAAPLSRMDWRVASLRELGRAYAACGGPVGLVRSAGGSAPQLVDLLVQQCPSWADVRTWEGATLRFCKRAQLLVSMLIGRLGGEGLGSFTSVDALSVFADYRLPQVFRGKGVMRLDDGLARRITAGEELVSGRDEEIALRAATVHAGALLRQALQRRHPDVDSLVVDYLLWRAAVDEDASLPRFHRTPTTDY